MMSPSLTTLLPHILNPFLMQPPSTGPNGLPDGLQNRGSSRDSKLPGPQPRSGTGPDSTVALPLWAYGPAPAPGELVPLQYWPFSSADMYTWKTNNPSFSENPSGLTGLLESLMARNPQISLLEYVDDLLLTASTQELCLHRTRNLLKELGELGYQVSTKKAQLCRLEVTYLGYTLREGKRWLTKARKKTVMQIPTPHHSVTSTNRDQENLTDQPWPGVPNCYMDGSSFVVEGKRRAGAAVVDGKQVIWASSLPEGTSAQKAELLALTQALHLAEGKAINIYTDSHYAFATAHIHGAIYRQRDLLTSAGRDVKNKEEILALLEAIHVPQKLAIVHCLGHQKGTDPVTKGNQMADLTAKQAAQGAVVLVEETGTPPEPPQVMDPSFIYPYKDYDLIEDMTGAGKARMFSFGGLAKTKDGRIILPSKEGQDYVRQIHQLTHLGNEKLKQLIKGSKYYVLRLNTIIKEVIESCQACTLTNAARSFKEPGKRMRGDRLGIYWEVDFTEIKPGKYGNKYLLVFIDTFSGWVEAFPTKSETAQMVTKKILEEILPQFGIPKVIGSDNGLAFVAQALEVVKTQIWDQIKEAYTPGTTSVPHGFQVGDSVLVRRHRDGTLEPRWKGPYLVLLTTPMAVKVDGITAWIHASHIKKAPSQNENNREDNWTVAASDNPLKLGLRHSPNLGE
ncbi:hypothetical protein NN561_003575 [Cricetulus griseus]